MKVSSIKIFLQNVLDELEQYDEDEEIALEPNTVGIDGDYIYVDGFRDRGFIDCNDIHLKENDVDVEED